MHALAAVSELARALSERGLEPRWRLRLGAPGGRVQALIDKIEGERTSAHLSTRQLREQLANNSLTYPQLELARAHKLANEYERAGAYTWIEHELSERYAFGPRTKALPCEWLMLHGRTLVLMRGRPWDWQTNELLVEDGHVDALLSTLDSVRARWADAGMREVGSEADLLVEIQARSPALDDQLLDADDDELPALAMVYNDWLLQAGDPRGVIGSAALHAGHAPVSGPAVLAVLGQLGGQIMGEVPPQRWPGLSWLGPLILSAWLPHPQSHELRAALHEAGMRDAPTKLRPEQQVEALLRLPAAGQVRRLVLANPFGSMLEFLGDTPAARSLRELVIEKTGAVRVRGQFPRLEQILIESSYEPLLVGSFARLTTLSVGLSHREAPLRDAFVGIDAPALRRLRLRVGAFCSDHGLLVEQLQAVLDLPWAAKLEELSFEFDAAELIEADFIHMFDELPCRPRLRRIDLRGIRLSETAREALEHARPHLPELRGPRR